MKLKLSSLLVLSLVLAACRTQVSVQTAKNTTDISLKDTIVHARVVETPTEQAKGLGGTASLDWDQGMLFPFANKGSRTFWMKDMLIPIDIIWLSDRTVVGIEKNVPEPSIGQGDAALLKYPSPDTVNSVLEVKAGFADKFDLKVGDMVAFK